MQFDMLGLLGATGFGIGTSACQVPRMTDIMHYAICMTTVFRVVSRTRNRHHEPGLSGPSTAGGRTSAPTQRS